MNKHLSLMLVTAIGITLAGCSAATKELTRMSQSVKTDLFTEINTAAALPSGFADVVIRSSIKIPLRRDKPYSFLKLSGNSRTPFIHQPDTAMPLVP